MGDGILLRYNRYDGISVKCNLWVFTLDMTRFFVFCHSLYN